MLLVRVVVGRVVVVVSRWWCVGLGMVGERLLMVIMGFWKCK